MNEPALRAFDLEWADENRRLQLVPGKEAIRYFNRQLQTTYGVSLTATGIVDAMKIEEIPKEVRDLLEELSAFSPRA